MRMVATAPTEHEPCRAGPTHGRRRSEPEATVKTLETTYEIILRGQLDPPMLALIAEYDLGDTPAQVVLRALALDRGTLDTFLDRAHALGIAVTRIRAVHGDAGPNGEGAAFSG